MPGTHKTTMTNPAGIIIAELWSNGRGGWITAHPRAHPADPLKIILIWIMSFSKTLFPAFASLGFVAKP